LLARVGRLMCVVGDFLAVGSGDGTQWGAVVVVDVGAVGVDVDGDGLAGVGVADLHALPGDLDGALFGDGALHGLVVNLLG